MSYREITRKEAHNMSVTGSMTGEGSGLEFEKQKIMNDINILSRYGFEATEAVYRDGKCDGYFRSEDLLMENYKDIKKWLLSLGYKVSLFPAAWYPCKQHWLTIEWG